jgi:two-component system, NarL family, response regulator NreC
MIENTIGENTNGKSPTLGKKIRCVLAHDHVLLRQGLRSLLANETDVAVVAEAGNAAEALGVLAEHRPDVIITAASTFGCTAEQVELLIASESPLSKVLFLTANDDAQGQEDAGAQASPQTSAQELVEIIRTMASSRNSGEKPMMREAPASTRKLWPAEKPRSGKRVLTAREREVLELLAGGRTVRSSAKILGLSAKTVDAHKFNLMRKLGIHNKAELVMWAIQRQIVKPPANF